MIIKEFDFDLYPLKLIVSVGMDYDTLTSRFENREQGQEGKWDESDAYESYEAYTNLVKDTTDGNYKILINFEKRDYMTMRTICHEVFHVAMTVCSFCNMNLGFNVGEDEHAAYIAGFVGKCVGMVFNEIDSESNKEDNGKESNKEG